MSKSGHYLGGHTLVDGGSKLVSHTKPEEFEPGPTADEIERQEAERDAVVREKEDQADLREKMEKARLDSLIARYGK